MVDTATAHRKAHKLFLSLLTDEQKKQLKNRAYFEVTGGTTGAVYRMYVPNVVGNIVCLTVGRSYCIYMTSEDRCKAIPTYDHLVAQLLHLKYNEKGFLKRAVSSAVYSP